MAYKPKPIKTTVAAALGDAFAEIQSLAEEMRETYDNMESANMGHMPKCEAAGEAADELEQHDEPDVPEELADLEVNSVEMVNKDKRKGTSRDMRLSNALALISDTKAMLEEYELSPEGLDKDNEVAKASQDLKDKAQELAEALDEHADISVEFPGMYG